MQTRSDFREEGNEPLNIIQITFTFQQILAVILISTLKITVKIQQVPNCSPLLYAQILPLSISCLHSLTVYSATHLYQKDEPKNVLKYIRSLSQRSLTLFPCLTIIFMLQKVQQISHLLPKILN